MGFDAADTAARLGCADRIERVRALDELVDASYNTESCSAIASEVAVTRVRRCSSLQPRCLVQLVALIDVEAGEELTCLSSLVVLCNLVSHSLFIVC